MRDLLGWCDARLLGGELGGALLELRGGEVGERAVGLDVEVAQGDGLHPVDGQARQGEHEGARQLGVGGGLQALGGGVSGVVEAPDVVADAVDFLGELGARDGVDRADVARGLEGDRRQLGGVGVDGERRG